MVNVIILGSPEGDGLADAVYGALSGLLPVAAVRSGGRVEGCRDCAEILLLECEQIRVNPGDKTILLCRHSFKNGAGSRLSGHVTVGVVQSDNAEAAGALGQWGVPVISCGMAATDTLTLSSLRTDSAVVCLQRSIPTLDGPLVEPLEIPVRLSRPCDAYALMCIVAVLLLCGRLDGSRQLLL